MIRNKVDAIVVMEPKGIHSIIVISWLCAKWKAKRILICGVKKNQIKHIGWEKYNNEKKKHLHAYMQIMIGRRKGNNNK